MKKPSKRKMYQKRRKKEKAEQRRKTSQTTKLPETTKTTAASFYKHNNNTKQNQRNIRSYQQLTQQNQANPITAYSQGLQLWWQTYCSAIEFHSKQQNLWRDENKQREMMLLEMYANEYETSSEEEEEDDVEEYECKQNDLSVNDKNMINENTEEADNVDEEYIKFLEITHRHREELRLKRAQENI